MGKAKGRKDDLPAIDNAQDNFANGNARNAPNDNAQKGLDNALENNPFSQGTVIDFDSGTWTTSYEYDYYYYQYIYGTYTEDGYTMDMYTGVDNYYYYYNNGDLGVPIHDSNGDGDNEMGVNYSSPTDDPYYYNYTYEYTSATIRADDGQNIDLEEVEIIFNDDGVETYYSYDLVQIISFGGDNNSNTYDYDLFYTYGDGTYYVQNYSYDYSTGAYDYTNTTTTDEDEAIAALGEGEYYTVYLYGDGAIDDMVFA
ncbi:hypothetical protein FHS89_001680 [Rubricella aquisinus]|uniref:Uncharacterized protein n=1 Tax=Rubricella aquisinus TaxID=2028108 RepID=A0A840WKP3_9RHOB|nr:hypothetical protein [Rubricella aquisinus]MBB5515668.1 hypothetical protein [Rubricella aquisinus]